MSKLLISRDTRMCMSLSGRPGNFGTRFQNSLYEELGLDYLYKAFSTTDLPAAIGGIRALSIRGCAVSMPFKEACIEHLDGLDPSAAAIGSVNTIVNDDGRLRGFNTDYIAVQEIAKRIDPATEFVIHGSGGMAKAVACAFRDAGFEQGTIMSRNQGSGRSLADACGYRWVERPDRWSAMLINVTPIGMAGGPEADALAFPEDAIEAASVVFDVVALPPETPLVRLAREKGIRVFSGAEVIVVQCVEQFVLYTGVRPNPAAVERAARFALS